MMTEQDQPDDANTPEVSGEAATEEDLKALKLAPRPDPDPSTPLDELIERERVQLIQICSMMRCLKDVLLYSDDDDGTMHADVADVSSRLLDDSIGRLEIIKSLVRDTLSLIPPSEALTPE